MAPGMERAQDMVWRWCWACEGVQGDCHGSGMRNWEVGDAICHIGRQRRSQTRLEAPEGRLGSAG